MLRLTIRSGRDGRFLTRIIDRGGGAFVMDFGDQRLIRDASQRLLKGFTMWRSGRLVTVTPQDRDLLRHLAELYATEGLLVFLEEPTWHGRRHLEDRARSSGDVVEDEDEDVTDDATEVASPDDVRRVVAALDAGSAVELTPDRATRTTWTPAPVRRVDRPGATLPPAPRRLPLAHHLPGLARADASDEGDLGEDDPTDLAPVPLAEEDDETEVVEPRESDR